MLGKDDEILEDWSVMAALAASTERVRSGLLHQSNLLRHPALVAKMVATLDHISGGRPIYYPDWRIPSCRYSSVSNGQSPIEPQHTTARMLISISSRPLATRASKSGEPSGRQGVMRAGVHPLNRARRES